jgi:hypothetical protein
MGILEIVAGALSAILGVLGIVTETKNAVGRLTRWGRLNLVLFITAALLAIIQRGVTVIEESASQYETRAQEREMLTLSTLQLRKATKAITDINRSMDLLPASFKAAFALSVQRNALPGAVAPQICQPYKGAYLNVLSKTAQLTLLSFVGSRPHHPGTMRMEFWKPGRLRPGEGDGNWNASPDLELEATLPTEGYYYTCNDEATVVTIRNYVATARVTRSSARIRSLEDLSGSRLFVDFSGSQCHWEQREACIMKQIHLATPMGRELLISDFTADQTTAGVSTVIFDRSFLHGYSD